MNEAYDMHLKSALGTFKGVPLVDTFMHVVQEVGLSNGVSRGKA